jgi:hypothetical protein
MKIFFYENGELNTIHSDGFTPINQTMVKIDRVKFTMGHIFISF